MTNQKIKKRVSFIDSFRGIALIFALSDHLFRSLHLFEIFPLFFKYPASALFRLATVIFLLCFGYIIEKIYKNPNRSAFVLYKRAIQVYFAFLVTLFFDWVLIDKSFTKIINEALFISPYGGLSAILKAYTVWIILLPSIIFLRKKYNAHVYIYVLFLLWTIIFILKELFIFSDEYEALSFFIGMPAGFSYYSILHGLGIIMLGAYIASFSNDKKQKNVVMIVLILLLLSLFSTINVFGIDTFVKGFVTNSFRLSHHYAYYLYASFGSLLIGISVWYVYEKHSLKLMMTKNILELYGRHSLIVFSLGNIVCSFSIVLNNHFFDSIYISLLIYFFDFLFIYLLLFMYEKKGNIGLIVIPLFARNFKK